VRADIDVYQGEDDDVRNNHRIGKFTIEGLSRVPSGNPILVQLDLTLDGTLKVTAKERATRLLKEGTTDKTLAKFQREERALAQERLNQLWEDQDEDEGDVIEGEVAEGAVAEDEEMPTLVPGPREGQREAVQARALLEKAQRLIEKASPEDKGE